MNYATSYGLILLIAVIAWAVHAMRKDARKARQRQLEMENEIKQRAKARKEMKAWESIPKTRMDKPTKLPTVHKRALSVPNVPLKPSYPPPKREEVVAVEPSRADDFLTGAMIGLVVHELFHDRPSGSVISDIHPVPIQAGGGGDYAGAGAEGSWSSSDDSSSSSSDSSSSSTND